MTLDWSLLTALIDRWRPETFTFRLRLREMTVTLQYVVTLLRLRINDPPVTKTDNRDWAMECERLLGMALPPMALKGRALKLTWLREQFLVDSLTDVQAQQHVCAYILI